MAGDAPNGKASMASQHPEVPDRRRLKVAPTDGGTSVNSIRTPLIPVACWRLDDPAFALDSSFVSPSFQDELSTLSYVVSANPGSLAAIFGHCDPAGSDALNKTLGDRRAIAAYALLTRQPDLWAYLYDNPQIGDTWDLHMVQTMLAVTADPDGIPYYAGAWDGMQGSRTTDAVRRFQADAGLATDGVPGPQTRKVLFGVYMDWLCTGGLQATSPSESGAPPVQGKPFRMQPADFLGGELAQPADLPKMSLQSCGKFNPVLLLSTDQMDEAKNPMRNAQDAPNRRIVIFFFPRGTKVEASVWPCPKVKDTSDACKGAFWPDGDTSRQNGDAPRLYKETRDTMACRFYDRFARRSPCERVTPQAYPFDLPPQKFYVPPQTSDDGDQDLRLASNDPSFIPGPGRTSSPTLPPADGAVKYVVVTTVTRPTIVFDHGFLDSNDGKHNLDQSKHRSPTASDYAALVKWRIKLKAAQTLRPDLFDATNAYEHFLSATGTDWFFSYEKFASDDESGKTILGSTIADVVQAASLLNNSRGITASTNSDLFTIQTTDAIPVQSGDARYPYPETEDWQKAIGAHVVWIEASVHVTTDASDRRYFLCDVTLHGEDEYNFNPGMKDIATGIPDSDNGVFEITGLAKEFRSVSKLQRTITFSEDASFVPVPGTRSAPSDLKTTQVR